MICYDLHQFGTAQTTFFFFTLEENKGIYYYAITLIQVG